MDQHQPKPQCDEEEAEEMGRRAVRLASLVVVPMVLKSAIDLDVIDIIFAAGDLAWLSPADIAARLPTSNLLAPLLLDRMLGLLASYDILRSSLQTDEHGGNPTRVYSAGLICKFFTKNENEGPPLSLVHHDKVFMETWYHLNEVILEGGMPFNRAHGMTAFEYMATDQRLNRVFNQAMSNHSTWIMKRILDIYRGFEGINALVDVGGGVGVTLHAITSKYPHLKGINYDLPNVIEDAPSYPGVEHVEGDMFVSVPNGDAIFMKWILHDWSDEHCLKLLANCWEALPSTGKVIVVESILPEAPKNDVSSHIVFQRDLLMFTLTPGGKERTHKEYDALAQKSGFSGCQLICCAFNSWVMEFHKTPNS